MKGMHGIIFAYGKRPKLQELVELRVADALPFAARYRMIDFMLSNMINAGVTDVGVILQERYQSMLDHLGTGKDWDLSRKHGGLRLLPSIPVNSGTGEFRGKLEALASIEGYIREIRQDYVVMTEGQLAANMSLEEMLREHIESGADITIACTKKYISDDENMTMFKLDGQHTIVDTVRRTAGVSGYRSLDVYVLSKDLLLKIVEDCKSHNFFHMRENVLQGMKDRLRLHGYVFGGYAANIFSVSDYYDCSMELLNADVRADLFNSARPIRTRDRSDTSTYYGVKSDCKNSLVADGCVIDGKVENSILFRGAHVEEGVEISNCILMQDTIIHRGTILKYVIADKQVEVLPNRTLMGHARYPLAISKQSVV